MGSFGASQNPFVQGLSLILGAALLVGALILGAFLLAIAVGFGLVAALIIMARIWWIQRRLARAGRGASGPTADGRVIEVEYTVIDEKPDERQE
jgi:hypothetical protein